MMDEIAISAQDISKMYLLYKKPVDRLKQSLFRPFGKDFAQTFWALRNVSFAIRRGQAFGIIGRNGSGKSTLLQILAGTLQPTSGNYFTNGRAAAILELGAGFNVEFTGRENIFLNGATLGIPDKEMHQRVDEIIDFAQIGDFIDQPVKFYSSGMFVRLAFAIATSINPDILLVDEALAVGDAGFVIKCMNRMKQMREKGCTIILVTHDVQTVRTFCDEAMWLHEGKVQCSGNTSWVTSEYLRFLFDDQPKSEKTYQIATINQTDEILSLGTETLQDLSIRQDLIRWGEGNWKITGFTIGQTTGKFYPIFNYGDPVHIEFEITALTPPKSTEVGFAFSFRNLRGLDIITSTTYDENIKIPELTIGQKLRVSFDLTMILAPGEYALVLNIEDRAHKKPMYYDFIENATIIKVLSSKLIYSVVLPSIEQRIWIPN